MGSDATSVDEGDEGPASGGTGDGGPLSRDVIFDVLSSTRRRYVLHYLRRNGGRTNLRDLSTIVAAWEYDTTPEGVSSKQRTRVYTALRQSHLPKMDREGILEFDPTSGDVVMTEEATDLGIYLDVVPHDEVPWNAYYLGVGLLGTLLAVASWFDVFPLGAVPPGAAAVLIAIVVLAMAVVHTYFERKYHDDEGGPPP